MKLFKNQGEKKKSTYEQSLKKYPELMNFIQTSIKNDKFVQKERNFILYWKAYRRIVGYVIRYANSEIKPKKWREVYGILIGSVSGGFVLIKDAIPMVSGNRAGVEYENQQYVDMASINEKIYETAIKDKENDFIVGWWHSHPGFGFFYSPVDMMTHLGYQSVNQNAIGLIFDHTKFNGNSTAIAGLRLKDETQSGLNSTRLPSDYEIVDLILKPSKEKFISDISPIIDQLKENRNKISNNLFYIKDTIKKRALTNLHKEFGLIPPSEDYIEEENDLYVWKEESEFNRKLPSFREALEQKMAQYKMKAEQLKSSGNERQAQKEIDKLKKEIKNELRTPREFCKTIIKDYKDKIKEIVAYWDYLDSEERLLCNNVLNELTGYAETLKDLTMGIL